MTIINQKSISGITSITFASAGDDLLTFHSNNGTERFRIDNSGNTKITAGIVTTLTVTGTTTLNGNLDLQDDDKILIGTGDDLEIYHDGSHSYIDDSGTGDLRIRSNNVRFDKYTGETIAQFIGDGRVELYYDNTKRFETTTTGVKTLGDLSIRNSSNTQHILYDESESALEFIDNVKATFGAGNDLQIYHDSSNSRIKNTTGSLWLQSDTGIRFTDADVNESMAAFYDNGAVELYYDGTKRFETKSDGVDITGELQCDTLDVDGNVDFDGSKITFDSGGNVLKWADNVAAYFGTGDDLRIYHDGSNSYIDDAGTGNLKLNGNEVHILSNDNSEYSGRFISNGAVELYHDGNKKFETLNNGVRAQGGILFGSDTADANTLDDYEEGTYTPTFTCTSGSITLNGSYDIISYEKIGNCCHVHGRVRVSSVSSPSGTLTIGLPFTRANPGEDSARIGGTIVVQNGSSAVVNYLIHPTGATGAEVARGDTSSIDTTVADNFSGDELVYISVTYRTA